MSKEQIFVGQQATLKCTCQRCLAIATNDSNLVFHDDIGDAIAAVLEGSRRSVLAIGVQVHSALCRCANSVHIIVNRGILLGCSELA